MKVIFVFLLLTCSRFCLAQTIISDYGVVNDYEIALKECSFDKDAEAVVIFDKAVANFNEEHNLITERRVRLKILKEKGIESGNIRIPYYSADQFEYINNLKATILNVDENNHQEWHNLDNKSIFNKKINKYFSEISFALPDVKVGSIIEYSYQSLMKDYNGLDHWYFQKEVPVMLSSYLLYIIPNAEFTYQVKKSWFLWIDIKADPKEGNIFFEMKNIPALRQEAFMASAKDYLQRVHFQFSGYRDYMGKKQYSTTWKELGKEFLEYRDFGAQINKTLSNTEILKTVLKKSPFEKMNQIYEYVRASLSWNNIDSWQADEGVKSVWEKKKGNSAEINFILINLLRSAGIEVYPILISERSHGQVDTTYPFRDQFNKVAAFVIVDGNNYILDATDKHTPSYMIPFEFLNTIGFIVDKKKGGLVRLNDNQRINRNTIILSGSVNENGIMKGQASVNNYEYEKITKKEKYNGDKKKYEEDEFIKPYTTLQIDSFTVSGLDTDSLPLINNFKINYTLNKSGDYYLMNYNLFTGFEKNPFIAEKRFTNIDFGCKYSCLLNGQIHLPGNLLPESLPKDMKLVTPENSLMIIRQISKKENDIYITVKIDFNKIEFSPNEYNTVRDFFKQMLSLLNEPIVLKSKS